MQSRTKATRTNKSFIRVLWSAWSDGVVAHWVELIALEVEAAISSFTDLGPPQAQFTRSCVCPNTRIVSAGGWPQAPSRGGAQESITVAIRRKIRMSKAVFPSLACQTWASASQLAPADHNQQ